jgi:hypothetical protein
MSDLLSLIAVFAIVFIIVKVVIPKMGIAP